MAGRTVTVTGLGDLKAIEDAFRKAGYVVDDTADQMVDSVKRAGAAAAEASKQAGASADEQAAAAGRAAAAFVDAQDAMTRSQRAAATAAASAAKAAGSSADEQQAAYERAAAAAKASADEQDAAAKRTAAAQDATAKSHEKLVGLLSKTGEVTLGALTVAGVAAVKLGVDFESAAARVKGATGQTNAEVQKLTSAFGGTAGKFEESGQEMEAAYAGVAGQLKLTEGHVLGAGEALKFQSQATELAEASSSNLNTTTSTLAGTMQAYHLKVSQAGEASDELFNISRGVGSSVEAVGTAVDKLHARLGVLSPTLTDTGALMLDLGKHGISGTRGIQVVNTALQTLVGGSEKTTQVLQALGVHVFDQQGKFVGLQSVIEQLQPKLDGLSQKQQILAEQTLFGKGAAQIMGQVIAEGAPKFQQLTEATSKAGTAQQAAAAKMETLKGEGEMLAAAVKTLGGDFGLILTPEVKAAGVALGEGVQWLEKHKAAAEALGGVITGVLGLAVSVYAYTKAVAFVNATKEMISGVTTLATTITAKAGIVDTSMAGMGTSAGDAATETVAAEEEMAGAYGGMSQAAEASATAAADAATGIGGAFTAAVPEILAVAAAIASVKKELEAPVSEKGGSLISDIGGFLTGGLVGNRTYSPLNMARLALGEHEPSSGAHAGGKQTAGSVEALLASPTGGSAQQAVVAAAAKKYGIPASVLWGVYGNETSYGSNVSTSSTGAQGAFQFEPGTAAEYHYPLTNKETSGVFKQQAEAAAHYLSVLIAANHGNVSAALEQYSGGTPGYAAEAMKHAQEASQNAGSNASVEQAIKEAASGKTKTESSKKTAAALGIPTAVATMLATAQALLGAPYTSGGGHGSSANDPVEMLKKIGIDCSGFVSRVLASGGLPTTGLTTEGLASSSALTKGAGRYVTVYDRANAGVNSHTLIDILGHFFESGGSSKYNPTGGVSLLSAAQAAGELAGGGFQAYHPTSVNAPVRGGLTTEAASVGVSAAQQVANAIATQLAKLNTSGSSLFKKYEADLQTGKVSTLEKLIGSTTANRSGSHSVQHAELDTLIKELRGAHVQVLTELASKLVTVHHEAQATLTAELLATQEQADARLLSLQATQLKDQTQIASDMAAQVVQAMKDATQAITDSYSAQATAIKDQTREMSDAASAAVSAIQDQSKITTDTLAERGLYGLNLVAQQQQVQLDEMKSSYDQQIAAATSAVDSYQTSTDKASAATQAIVDAVTTQQNALISQAQANLDNVTAVQDQAVQEAQNRVAAVAQGTQAQQQTAQAALTHAEAAAAAATGQAQAAVAAAQANANRAEQEAQNALANAQGNAGVVLAQAEQALVQAQDQANIAEAKQQALVEETKERATTQYAGSGLSINITGINPTDAAAIASEVGWELRTQVPL